MGISKRNPRSNFNWQSRYLKKKAVCCGQLDEPFDCNTLAPIPVINTTRLCVTTPPSTQSISAANASTVPSSIVQNTNNTYTLYKDGVMIDTQFVASGAYEYLFSGTLASAGLYEVEITNQFGCTERSGPVQVNAYQVPTVTATVVDSTISCVPPPIGGPGDGEVTLTVTNPVPGYAYTFRLCYDLGPPIFLVCYPDQTSVSVSATFTGLCPARYFGTVCVEIPGLGPQCCSSSLTIDVANA